MRKNRRCAASLLLFLLGLVVLISPLSLHAQIQNGEVVGIIADPSGAVLTAAMPLIRAIPFSTELFGALARS